MNPQWATVVIGLSLGLGLLIVGGVIGFRWGRKPSAGLTLSEEDRQRMRHLLLDLGSWTHEYSGNVSQYNDQLGRIEQAVRVHSSTATGDTAAGNRVLTLLQQIMESNSQLQTRLEAAENQLERQTRQIEGYLTEARTDGLTGLANRRAFDQRLEEMFATYRNGGRSFVVALIDVDKFKSINDNHGHPVGDQVLQRLSATLRTQLAGALLVARFGGEEFVVLMDGPLKIAAEKMNEVRRHFAAQRIDVGAIALQVTISVGLSEPRNETIVAPIIRHADEALYAAKNLGRNRVYFHDGNSPVLVGAPETVRDL